MPRTRTIPVIETLDTLRRLERATKGELMRARISMLRLLKEDPSRTLKDVARELGISHFTIKKWWGWYVTGGVLRLRRDGIDTSNPTEDRRLHILRDALTSGSFRTLDQVHEWLSIEEGAPLVEGTMPARVGSSPASQSAPALMKFLNALPHTLEYREATDALKLALINLFDDIDHVTVLIDLKFDLLKPEEYRPAMMTLDASNKGNLSTTEKGKPLDPKDFLLKELKRRGFPIAEYQTPLIVEYDYKGSPIGTIIYWRRVKFSPISRLTAETIESLRHFIVFLFSDIIVRMHHAQPIGVSYMNALDAVAARFGLTGMERRVLVLTTNGMTPEQIADSLSMSRYTARAHIRKIYKKLDVHSVSELFARHLSPRS